MKKIIMAVAAVAMASSMFAADISAQAKSTLNLMKADFSGDTTKFSLLDLNHGETTDDTKIALSFSGDKAGAAFQYRGSKGQIDEYNMWIQPTDAVKISLHTGNPSMNQETITWWKYNVLKSNTDINVELKPVDGLTITTGFKAADRNWASGVWMNDAKDDKFNETAVKVAFGADFGTISAMYRYNTDGWYPFAQYYGKHNFAAGYSGNIGGVALFSDFGMALKDNLSAITADLSVSFGVDALKVALYGLYSNYDMDTTAKNLLITQVKLTYGLDSCVPYLKYTNEDTIGNKGKGVLDLGATFNIGVAAMDASVSFDIAGKVLTAPVTATISF